MSSLVKSLEDVGYVDGKSLFGAPYDFRYGPGTKSSSVGAKYLENLRKLVEEAYTSNGDKQVILVSHSLGGLWVLYFLNQQPLSWRKRYIKHFVAIAAPWGGTVQEMRTFASGYSLGIPLVNPLLVREEQRSSESNLWLLPIPEVFGNRTLVITEQKHYSASDMPEFFTDIGFSEGIACYKSKIRPLTEHLEAPRVPITLMFGTGISTPEMLVYGEGGFDQQPKVIEGDGDGTVNFCSLSAVISDWSAAEGQTMKVVKIPQSTHTTILKNDDSIQKIVDEILSTDINWMYSVTK
jgi:pimeloyl-ACP methyl ester carboxylesterase